MPRYQSPTALRWPYPLLRPSVRFRRFNDYVRQLDVRFAALPPADQGAWAAYGFGGPWTALCLDQLWLWPDILLGPITGVDTYRGVNTCRLSQGLPVSDTPPLVTTAPDNDRLDYAGSGLFECVWTGRSGSPGGSFAAAVSAIPLMHAAERGPAQQKYRYAFTAPITYGAAFDLEPLRTALPGCDALPYISVGVTVSDSGGGNFFGGRIGFDLPI